MVMMKYYSYIHNIRIHEHIQMDADMQIQMRSHTHMHTRGYTSHTSTHISSQQSLHWHDGRLEKKCTCLSFCCSRSQGLQPQAQPRWPISTFDARSSNFHLESLARVFCTQGPFELCPILPSNLILLSNRLRLKCSLWDHWDLHSYRSWRGSQSPFWSQAELIEDLLWQPSRTGVTRATSSAKNSRKKPINKWTKVDAEKWMRTCMDDADCQGMLDHAWLLANCSCFPRRSTQFPIGQ
jgi:hypothetical protein